MIAKEGVIFDYSALHRSNKRDSRLPPLSGAARMTVFLGNFFIFVSILGFAATFGPMLYHEANFRLKEARGISYEINSEIPQNNIQTTRFGEILNIYKKRTFTPKDTSFNILIPKLGINEKIFANVDPSLESEYVPILQKGAAHAKGTYFPGQDGNIYIFAHSGENFWDGVNVNNIFYLLKDLEPEDEIVIFFNNKRYNYKVEKSKIVSASEVSFITQAKTGKERLVLQTCWPPLTTWKRLLVFAKPISKF